MTVNRPYWPFLLRLLTALVVCFGVRISYAVPPLPALAANLDERLTVSGISSGAYMAVQFQVAHAQLVRGAGIIAGGPYNCAQNSALKALSTCSTLPPGSNPPDPAALQAELEKLASVGKIDSATYLRDDRVWLFSGGKDRVVKTAVMEQLAAFYAKWLPDSAIRFVKFPAASHAMISTRDQPTRACDSKESPYINRCGDFDAAGEMLVHLLGTLRPPNAVLSGKILAFDQQPFIDGKAIDASLDETGYVYVPNDCLHARCRVHVAFHGCRQSARDIGRRFVDGAGYNAWADSNRLIVLYPQTVPRRGPALGSMKWINNPFACWDWWGYSGDDYPTRHGVQIKAVRAMLEKLARPRETR